MFTTRTISVITLSLFVAGCGGGSGGSSSTSNTATSTGSSSSSFSPAAPSTIKIDINDGTISSRLEGRSGSRLQYTLNEIYSSIPVKNISGCGLDMQTLETIVNGYRLFNVISTSDCEINIIYDLPEASGAIVSVEESGYGGSLHVDYVYVGQGKSLTLPVTIESGYVAQVSGCAGKLSGNVYRIDEVTSNCTIQANFNPANPGKAVTVQVNYSGGDGGRKGSETYKLATGHQAKIDMSNSWGYEAVASGSCGADTSANNQGVINAAYHFTPTRDCELNVNYALAKNHSLVAYVNEDATYRVTNGTYGSNAEDRKGRFIATEQDQWSYLDILPIPGYKISYIDGCQTDNDKLPLHQRTLYPRNHTITNCAVKVETEAVSRYEEQRVDVLVLDENAWGEVTFSIPKIPSAWSVFELERFEKSFAVIIHRDDQGPLKACGRIKLVDRWVLVAPDNKPDLACGLQVRYVGHRDSN